MMTYSERLKDPRWQKRRLEVMEYANWRCQICNDKGTTLHCHHSHYTRGKMPWQYPKGSIICVCERCHKKIHTKPEPIAPRPETVEVLVADQPAMSVAERFDQLRALLGT